MPLKSERITIRLFPEELARIRADARVAGMPASQYLRHRLMAPPEEILERLFLPTQWARLTASAAKDGVDVGEILRRAVTFCEQLADDG